MHISVSDLQKIQQESKKALIIDLRSNSEFNLKNIKSSINIPFESDALAKIQATYKSEDAIILYCETEVMSVDLFFKLKDVGFKNVKVLRHGFEAWDSSNKYNRQINLDGFGEEGQIRLHNAKVLFIGAGGVSSTGIAYLAAAGVGKIGIVDSDIVELNNLHRQIIHSTSTVGMQKVDSAKQFVNNLNPDVVVELFPIMLAKDNISEIFKGYDFVLDGSDNFETKYLINDTCNELNMKYIIGSVQQMQGQVFVSLARSSDSGCLRCLFPEAPESDLKMSCKLNGILGTVTGIAGTILSNEVMKHLTIKKSQENKLITFDLLENNFTERVIKRNASCRSCQRKNG